MQLQVRRNQPLTSQSGPVEATIPLVPGYLVDAPVLLIKEAIRERRVALSRNRLLMVALQFDYGAVDIQSAGFGHPKE
jgi:hypothetical protein